MEVFVGDLPQGATKKQIKGIFSKFGNILSIELKVGSPPFCFITFEDPRDAEDAIKDGDGYLMAGSRLRVETCRGVGGTAARSFRPHLQIIVKGLPKTIGWQDLKEQMRKRVGAVAYANIFEDGVTGMVEFVRPEDADKALRVLNNTTFKVYKSEFTNIRVHRRRYDNLNENYEGKVVKRYRSHSRSPIRRYAHRHSRSPSTKRNSRSNSSGRERETERYGRGPLLRRRLSSSGDASTSGGGGSRYSRRNSRSHSSSSSSSTSHSSKGRVDRRKETSK